jgi:amino acid adenylation domain-containing protein
MAPLLARILAPGGDDRRALCAGAVALSYGQLRGNVLEFSAALARAHIGAGDRVAIFLPKTVTAVTAILGALAAGAAYVPLNHRLSLAQLSRVLADLRPTLLIAEPPVLAALQASSGEASSNGARPALRLALVTGDGALELVATIAGEPGPASPAELAAILYTSGSTGEPKGIMLTHGNIASFVDWAADAFSVCATDKLVNHAPLHFDLSIFDIFCGLSRQAGLCLIDEATARFPGAIRQLLVAEGVTVWYSVPTALIHLQRWHALKEIPSLRLVLFAGEVFPVPLLRQLMRDAPAPEYVNLYGPTETNVCTAYRLPGAPDSDFEELPIGWPCRHLQVSLLDAIGAPVPAGETGEICVSGPAVMHGYWGRGEATAAVRLAGRPDSYRTGDYAHDRGDGALMFAGRRDQQVKVRGHRVELLALETVLNAHPQISQAAALFIPQAAHGGAIAAFVVARGARPALPELRAFIADRLAPHYQPDEIEWLEELPRTANGKCDRVRLQSAARQAIGD